MDASRTWEGRLRITTGSPESRWELETKSLMAASPHRAYSIIPVHARILCAIHETAGIQFLARCARISEAGAAGRPRRAPVVRTITGVPDQVHPLVALEGIGHSDLKFFWLCNEILSHVCDRGQDRCHQLL